MDTPEWVSKERIIVAILSIVLISIIIWGLSQLGARVIDATGVVFSLILTGALVLLYRQQKDILGNQTSLMAIRYEPKIRIQEVGTEEDRLYLALSNGGNGPAEKLNIRCDIFVNFESTIDEEYSRMEEHVFEKGDGEEFTLEPSYRGLRPATGGLSIEDVSLTDVQEAVQGTHIDPTSEPAVMEVEVDVTKHQVTEENGAGKRLHAILNELADSGVEYASLYFTLVGKDMAGKVHSEFITAKSRMEIHDEFESLVDVFQTEAFGHVGLPEEIEDEITADERYPPI